jgi:2'-5' RNA ligase
MKRIFIAIKTEPEETFQRMYASLRAALGNENITWVSPENIHLTLVFLGEIEEERIKIAGIVLKQKCTGFGEFVIRLSGTGVFRNLNEPKVLWLGIENPDRLIMLSDLINTGLKDTGFKIEDHPFNPHITLGRIKFIKNKEILRSAIARYQDIFIQEVHVRDVILYESILKPEGPIYRPIGTFRIK